MRPLYRCRRGPQPELTGIAVAGRWIHVHAHVHDGVRMLARGTSPASSSAGAGAWCSIGPPAGLGRPRGRPVFGLALAGARLAMANWLKAQPAAAAAVSCACWGVGACWRPRPMATAACRPATELRLSLALRHVRVLYPCAWFLLLTGRVYKHGAYMYVYEISPECEDEGAR